MIFLSPHAVSDIERVREFLDINNPEAAKRALGTIFAALERLQNFPISTAPPRTPTSVKL
jgi:plasmid stabilization system protein ParE